ncbi:NUMOD4 motif-containing HNH endonuclease [Phenylobacterium sp. VNQ135]|uniref:NUMOD4 motif-containing HNH endonuclease n=1 Tax=Phenylobacterium sp. VNQ135 TaxID=3400922 RepID=UPI003C12A4FF
MNAVTPTVAEEWRDAPGYPGYQVSSEGGVRSLDRYVTALRRGKPWVMFRRGAALKLKRDRTGYLRAEMGKGNYELVHRLVLAAFVGPCPAGCEGAHNDGRRDNNRLANLRWATKSENQRDRFVHGTMLTGERAPMAKLTAEQVAEMRSLANTRTQTQLAAEFGVCQAHVSDILRRKAWA